MARTLLLTGTTDILKEQHYKNDNSMEEVFDLTLSSKQKYVKKHGYDILAMRSFGVDKKNRFKQEIYGFIGFIRVLRALEMLEYYDYVMWIDADSIITNHDYSINDFQNEDKYCFYASWDWPGKNSFSTGNFIVHKGQNFDYFFDTFIAVGQHIVNTNQWGWEQTTLNTMYRIADFKNDMKILDHKYLSPIPDKILMRGAWGDRPDPPFPWTKESFLAHIGGISNADRIKILKESFSEYL